MIKKFKVRNFYSFSDEVEISFVLGKKPGQSAYDVADDNGLRINKVAGVIGANGSGKTQLLKVLPFCSLFIASSYQENEPEGSIPFSPHLLHDDQSTAFEIEFVLEGKDYKIPS